MATNILIQNCSLNEIKSIDLSAAATNIAVAWGDNAAQISISEINYCPVNAVITFRYLNADVYTYITQGLENSMAAFPACVAGPNPDNSFYSGPVSEIIIDTSAAIYPISLVNDTASGTYDDWELEIALSHNGDSSTKIYFTTDGSDPLLSNNAELYDDFNRPLLGGENLKSNIIFFKAVAVNAVSHIASAVLSYLYVFSRPIILTASVPHGYHIDKAPIALTASVASGPLPVIYYTTDGSDPLYFNGQMSITAIEYTGPITPITNEFTLKAVAVQDNIISMRYSNYVSNFYKYEEDVLYLTATPAGGAFPEKNLSINLATNDVNAVIKYSLDGSSPLSDNASLYLSDINIATLLDSQSFRLRAVAISDRLISEPLDITYTLYDYASDADGDNISNGAENGPLTDSDNDGISDMFDADSDNDGMPDYVEGVADANANNIPAFQDNSETIPFWYSVSGIPENGQLINGLQYEIKIICYGAVGSLSIETLNRAIVFSEISCELTPGEEKTIYMLVPEAMETACSTLWSSDAFDISFIISHVDPSTQEIISEIITRTYTIVPYNANTPYAGNLVTWTKLNNSKFYGIYRKNPSDSEYTRIAKILHDSYHAFIETQQYLDRNGEILSNYRVSAISDISESDLSNAMHAADNNLQTCSVIGHLADIAGEAMADIRVSARIDKAPTMQRNINLSAYELHTYTDEFGQFILNLPKGSVCIIKLEQANFRKKISVPFLDTIDLDALIDLNYNGA